MEIAFALALAVVVYFVVKRLALRATAGDVGRAAEKPVEKWARSEVARLLAERLDCDEAEVMSTLAGDPDPELVGRIEAAVRQIEIVYERALGQRDMADVRVEVRFENGDLVRSPTRVTWSELPAVVVAQFEETGGAHVYCAWTLPWSPPAG